MRGIFLSLVLTAGLAVSVSALDSLSLWSDRIWAQPLPPERDSVSVILTQEGPGKFKKTAGRTTYTVNPDGSYIQNSWGPEEIERTEFRHTGALISSTSENLKEKTTYHVRVSSDGKQASFRTETKGKDAVAKSQALKPDNLIMTAYVNLIRQAWRLGVREGFVFKGIAPDGSLVIDMETRLIETNIPWKGADQYEIPEDFRAAFPGSQKYLVADFNLGGMFSWLYRFHNYWIFRIVPSGLEYAGSFGGDPQKATFVYFQES